MHDTLAIADTNNREQVLEHLNLHNLQKTTYVEVSRGLAPESMALATLT